MSNNNKEEVKKIANDLADTIIQLTVEGEDIFPVVIDAEEIIDLDSLAGSVAGITDPLGQLKSWFIDVFNSTASWIVETVSSAVGKFIEDVLNAFNTGFEDLKSKFEEIVLDPFMNALNSFNEFLNNLPVMISQIGESISNIITQIGSLVTQVGDSLSKMASDVISSIQNAITPIQDALNGLVSTLNTLFSSLQTMFEGIRNTINNIIMSLGSALDTIVKKITSIIEEASSIISNFTQSIVKAFEPILSQVTKISEGISKFIEDLLKGTMAISDALTRVQQGFNDFISLLINVKDKAPEILLKVSKAVTEDLIIPMYDLIKEKVIDPLLKEWSEMVGNVSKGFETLSVTFQGYVNALTRLPEQLWSLLPKEIKDAITGLQEALDSFVKGLEDFLKDPLGFIQNAFSYLAEQIWNLLPDWVKDAITSIQDAINTFVNNVIKGLEDFFKDPLGTIRNSFSWLAEQIWKLLPEEIKNAIVGLQQAWEGFIKSLEDFTKDPLGFIQKAYSHLAEQIWKLLPEDVKTIIEMINKALKGFVKALIEEILKIIQDPAGWIIEDFFETKEFIEGLGAFIYKSIKSFFKSLPEEVQNVLKGMIDSIYFVAISTYHFFYEPSKYWTQDLPQVGKYVVDGIRGIMSYWKSFVIGAFYQVSDMIKPFIELAEEPAREFYRRLISSIVKSYASLVGKSLTSVIKQATGREIDVEKRLESAEAIDGGKIIYDTLVATVPISSLIKAIPELMRSYAYLMDEVASMLIKLALMGGVAGGGHSFFAPLVGVANVLDEVVWGIFRWASWSLTYWVFEPLNEPLRMLVRYIYRDVVPFREIPTTDLVRIVRRRMGLEKEEALEGIIEFMKTLLGLHGYPSYVVEMYTKSLKNLTDYEKIVIKDRFGVDRTIPLPLIYDLPTASEVCRMMVRDIFQGIEDFTKAIATLGYVPDIAYMYYLLHFKYPSPSTLWEFITRGISGLLWYSPTKAELSIAEKEAKKIGAFTPIEPTSLNFKAGKLFESFSTYMKWHDYARFSWLNGFTSDNWIVIDTLADIPTKIDVRWMTKWGLFKLMSNKKIGITTPVSAFISVVEDRATNEELVMDLSLMCRLLQGTGLHPYYVPIVSVAETINALSDERTLIRTGIINLFEVGCMNYETIDSILSGLLVASFKVAYFDVSKKEWNVGFVNTPIAYLPAERKLIEFRALIDRYLKVYKDVLSDVERAYREYIVSEEEGVAVLSSLVKSMNTEFKALSKSIVGRELELTVDTNYVMTRLKAQVLEREIYTVRRVRYWFTRILGWLIYRLAYATVTKGDIEKILNIAKNVAKYTPPEIKALAEIMNAVVGIAVREASSEYIPTPSQLATISEIIPEARKFFSQVVEARRVPKEWIPIWGKYIQLKPVVDEVKSLLREAERMFQYFEIDQKTFESVIEKIKPFGYEDFEIDVIIQRNILARQHRAYREIVGTLRELVTLAEYSPRARELALGEAYKMIDALPIDSDKKEYLKKMWEEYIRIKPVYDEVKREITELISDYANGIISWEDFVKLLEELKQWGIDEYEIEAYKFLAMARRTRYKKRKSS